MKTEAQKRSHREAVRRWQKSHPPDPKHGEYTRQWQKAHPEKNREKARRWRHAHPEKAREVAQRWKKANKEKCAQHSVNRRACVRGAEGSHTLAEWQECKTRYRYKCHWQIHPNCPVVLTDKTATRDHVVPISKGGSHSISNIVPACRSCNSRKWTRLLAA